jgi:processive 1,2-diacylglycerol beta-glucosyltransferase
MRALILTAGFGEGHNAAARAVAEAWIARAGAGTAPVLDVHAQAAPRLNRIARRAYLGAINRTPDLWRAIYGWLDRSRLAVRVLGALPGERRVLREAIARERPDAILCSFPGYAYPLAALRRAGGIEMPFFNIVTDSISLNSLWWRAGADGWFVPNAESAEVMRDAGVDEEQVWVTGFPVRRVFAEQAGGPTVPDPAGGTAPRVLQIVNSGTRHAAETAELLFRETDWAITCTVGRDEALRARLGAAAARRKAPTTILGWTEEIPRLLMTHHVVVSKAGGATTQEALAARCPMIVNQIVPGQEEGNYELLRRHGIGALAETPAATLAALREAFADEGRVWRRWRAALEPLCRPDAADEIAVRAMAEARAARTSEPVPMPLRRAALSA